ncbi:hypothetical protein MTX78_09920 [Hymenobacter tibetensis]|uniref:DUF4440 domain-containing protein n=1 Tax=Hymenobacter tibetensis TaxID=497967 RepID=A0ABY4D3H2_9BACT|nr:hypothetical protein [Hymenobacter tibetensis]UOG76897.1 hypothetical protein MTX78_09920 [Hymenobacter tibetensis]
MPLLPLSMLVVRRVLGPGLAVGALLAGCNPFAPGLDDMPADPNQLLGNPVTVRGFFNRFRSAYQLRDSTLYGQLLDKQFSFTFRDFAANVDRTWNRDVEISTTYKLFRASRTANLQWTQYLPTTDTLFSDTLVYVDRAFQLSIEQVDNQQYTGSGSARLVLVRKQKGDPWRMRSWYDRSEF